MLRLESEIAAMETALRRLAGVLPRLFQIESEYALALRQAELAWMRALVEDLRTGRLAWSQEQLRAEWGDGDDDRPLDLPTGLEVVDDGEEDRTMA